MEGAILEGVQGWQTEPRDGSEGNSRHVEINENLREFTGTMIIGKDKLRAMGIYDGRKSAEFRFRDNALRTPRPDRPAVVASITPDGLNGPDIRIRTRPGSPVRGGWTPRRLSDEVMQGQLFEAEERRRRNSEKTEETGFNRCESAEQFYAKRHYSEHDCGNVARTYAANWEKECDSSEIYIQDLIKEILELKAQLEALKSAKERELYEEPVTPEGDELQN